MYIIIIISSSSSSSITQGASYLWLDHYYCFFFFVYSLSLSLSLLFSLCYFCLVVVVVIEQKRRNCGAEGEIWRQNSFTCTMQEKIETTSIKYFIYSKY